MKSSSSTKSKFVPTRPKKRPAGLAASQSGADDGQQDREGERTSQLVSNYMENRGRQGPRSEKKSTVQVTLAPGNGTSSSIRPFNFSPCRDASDVSSERNREVYSEPKEIHGTNDPISLPMIRPSAGDPEAAQNMDYDENDINAASDLGLLEKKGEENLLLFQFPPNLPLVNRSAGGPTSSGSVAASKKGCTLKELPGGHMGKLLVYKSGVVKMKLGEVLYDVSPGIDCETRQDVAAVNTKDKQFCGIKELCRRGIVTPDVDSLLEADERTLGADI